MFLQVRPVRFHSSVKLTGRLVFEMHSTKYQNTLPRLNVRKPIFRVNSEKPQRNRTSRLKAYGLLAVYNATLFSGVFTGKSCIVYSLVVVDVADCGLLVTLATQSKSSEDSLTSHYLEAMCQSAQNIADTFSFVFFMPTAALWCMPPAKLERNLFDFASPCRYSFLRMFFTLGSP